MGAGVKEEMGAVSEMNLPEEMRNVVLGQAHYHQESCVLIFEKLLTILCIVSVIPWEFSYFLNVLFLEISDSKP